MRKVIITGANGFIGSALANYLANKGVRVFAIVRNKDSNIDRINKQENIEIVYCELSRIKELPSLILEKDFDAFYHFAWSGVSDHQKNVYPSQINNIHTTCDCVEVCNAMNCQSFIFASSLWEYECLATMKAEEPVKLSSLYSSAKIAAHFMGRTLCNHYGIRFMAGIITNAYGVGETSDRLVISTIRKLLNKEETAFTSSTQTYDFIYIEDTAEAFYQMGLNGKNNKSYYIGSMNPRPLKEFLLIIKDCMDKDIELGIGKLPQNGIHLDYSIFDLYALKKDTGFAPKTTFEDGIHKTVNWLKSQRGEILEQ
ncbi:NAD-dependent epimerase/dehydratase family protein [Neobacillus sp. Marseille-QA0830]